MKLTDKEKSLIIQLLDKRRVYFEDKNKELARELSELLLKVYKL
jgi:hypothetical protein